MKYFKTGFRRCTGTLYMIVNVHVTVSTLYIFIFMILPIENVDQNIFFMSAVFLETPVLVKRIICLNI